MKNIIFDFGGVLLEWSSDNFYKPYFNHDEKALNKFYADTQIKVLNKELDRGLPFDKGLKNLAKQHPEHADAIFLWQKAWHKMLGKEITGSIDILQKLHQHGYNLFGLTNWSAETFPYVYYKHEFFHLFKDIVVSGRENCIKPEPEIYQLCLRRNNISAQESIFIDDSLENITAANKLGITGIHFTNADNLYS